MPYIIERLDQGGGFVAPSGSALSYVRRAEYARQFSTRGEAERNRCPENETVREYHPAVLR